MIAVYRLPCAKRLVPRWSRKPREQGTLRKDSGGDPYAWRKRSKNFLLLNPLCIHCKKRGIYTKAQHTDHIIPHRGDVVLYWDYSNLQALCSVCHAHKTNRERKARAGR